MQVLRKLLAWIKTEASFGLLTTLELCPHEKFQQMVLRSPSP